MKLQKDQNKQNIKFSRIKNNITKNEPLQPETNNRLIRNQFNAQQSKQAQVKQIINKLKLSKQIDADLQNQLKQSKNQQQKPQQSLQQCCTCEQILQVLLNLFKSSLFYNIHTIIIILFCINIGIQSCNINSLMNQITKNIDLVFQIFFTFTIFLKLLTYHEQSLFLIILDIVTNVCGYISFGLSDQYQIQRYLKAIRTLRIIFIIKQIQVLNASLTNLTNSLRSVGKILFPAAMFIYFYAVIGLFSFRDYQYSKCRDPSNKFLSSNWTVYTDSIFLCGQKGCPIINGIQYECLNPIQYGVQPNYKQVQNIMQGNGLMRYNNIFFALFSTFKQMFVTGSSRLMLFGKQVLNQYYVLIYYLSFCYLLAYIYLNIFYGLLMSNQGETQKDQNVQIKFIGQLLQQQQQQQQQQQRQQQQKQGAYIVDEQNFKQKQIEQKYVINQKLKIKHTQSLENYDIDNHNQSIHQLRINIKQTKTNILNVSSNHNNKNNIKFSNKDNQIISSHTSSQYDQVIKFGQTNAKMKKSIIQSLKIKKKKQINKQKSFQTLSIQKQHQQGEQQQQQQQIKKYSQIMRHYYFIHHIVVILCSINICIDYQGQSQQVRFVTDCIDFVFFCVYLIQMIFRYIIHKRYVPHLAWSNDYKMQLCLFMLVCANMIYEAVTSKTILQFVIAADDVSLLLRTMKYLRLFILINSSPYFKQAKIIFNSIFIALYQVRHFIVLWFLNLLIFSIMGYYMFNGKTKVDSNGKIDLINGKSMPVSFQGLNKSIIFTVFAFFNQEWDWFLFQQYPGAGTLIVLWQLLSLVIGLQVMSKYFMALLMNQIGIKLDQQSKSIQQSQQQLNQVQQLTQKSQHPISNRILNNKGTRKQITISNQNNHKNKIIQNKNIEKNIATIINKKTNNNINQVNLKSSNIKKKGKLIDQLPQQFFKHKNTIDYEYYQQKQDKIREINNNISHKQSIQLFQIKQNKLAQTQQRTNKNKNQSQLFHLNKQPIFYQLIKSRVQIILKSKIYVCLRIIIIIASILITLLQSPIKNPQSEQMKIYYIIWIITVILFLIDILMNMFIYGVINIKSRIDQTKLNLNQNTNAKTKSRSYFLSPMNCIFFLISIIQFLNIFFSQIYLIQSLLCLRILRIFIFIQLRYKSNRDMRITIIGFWKLLPKVINLLIGTLLLYGFFAILLVKIYKNDFYYCDGHSHPNGNVDTVEQCLEWGGNWVQRKLNVSNFIQSLVYLFLQATTQGWSTQVIQAASLRGQGKSPIINSNQIMYFFFSIFFFFGNLIMLNAFLGLSINNFKKIKQQMTGFNKLKQLDKTWFSIKNNIYRMIPLVKQKIPQNMIRKLVYRFMQSKCIKILKLIFFVLFMINMSFYETNMSEQKFKIVQIILDISTGVFILQYFLKLLSYGIHSRNIKKLTIQTIAILYMIISLILTSSLSQLQPHTCRILQAINVCLICIRYFALLTQIQFIKKMINSLITIFPLTTNIWLLIFIILLTYATIGIELFSYLRIGPQLNDFDQNYTSLDKAIFALIKFSILQSPIGQIMDAASKSQPNAVCFDILTFKQYQQYGRMGCGNKLSSYLFFMTFQVFYGMILMSTLMAVIFDAYSDVRRQQQSMINKFQLELVRNQWQNYDSQGTGYISYRDFWRFTGKIITIYKVSNQSLLSNQTKQSFLQHLNISIYQDQNSVLSFQFHQVIQSLTRIVLKQKYKQFDTTKADKHFNKNNQHNIQGIKIMKKSYYNSSHVLKLITLKSGLRNWKRKSSNLQIGMKFVNILDKQKHNQIK